MTAVYNFGSLKTDTLTGKTFRCATVYVASGAANGYPAKIGASTYQVPVGKTFTIVGLLVASSTSITAPYNYIVYANDSTIDTTIVSTNISLPYIPTANVTLQTLIPVYSVIPASKYLGIQTSGTGVYVDVGILGFES